ncbi:MAG TPA: DM13 domain-containing protein [Actinomycetota bacterium]|nr:DM13 domain-containing protein [Actinomycetota bacterium]
MKIVSTAWRWVRRHPGRAAAAGVIAAGLLGSALYWFAPWNLFVDRRVDEAFPAPPARTAQEGGDAVEVPDQPAGGREDGDVAAGAHDSDVEAPAEPVALARGRFRALEHATSGAAIVLELDDGTRYLRLQGLETSNGPDLRVLLSDQPISDDWHVWADGDHLDLGPLKGNLGSSNYEIPADADLSAFRTAVIWCRRFTVGFGVAPLHGPLG